MTAERPWVGLLPEVKAKRDTEPRGAEQALADPEPGLPVRGAEQPRREAAGRHSRAEEEDRRLVPPRDVRARVELGEREDGELAQATPSHVEPDQRDEEATVEREWFQLTR